MNSSCHLLLGYFAAAFQLSLPSLTVFCPHSALGGRSRPSFPLVLFRPFFFPLDIRLLRARVVKNLTVPGLTSLFSPALAGNGYLRDVDFFFFIFGGFPFFSFISRAGVFLLFYFTGLPFFFCSSSCTRYCRRLL